MMILKASALSSFKKVNKYCNRIKQAVIWSVGCPVF
jgi:hypothetical protein